MQGRLQR
jgi:hypothetical protein